MEKKSDEWYTPKEIIDLLGPFETDPCAPVEPLFRTAKIMYNKNDDGLSKEWKGRVFLNPPYSQPLLDQFMCKMAEHGRGIALLFNRCDSRMFRQYVLEKATAIFFLYKRIRFLYPNGKIGNSPRCGNILVAYGREEAEFLKDIPLEGKICFLDL